MASDHMEHVEPEWEYATSLDGDPIEPSPPMPRERAERYVSVWNSKHRTFGPAVVVRREVGPWVRVDWPVMPDGHGG